MTERTELPAPYQNMTPEEALDEAFKTMLKDHGKTQGKLYRSRQIAKELLIKGDISRTKKELKEEYEATLRTLIDMFDIAEMTFDHIHSAKLIYDAYKRQFKGKTVSLVKESVESYLAFYQGEMIPLRHDDSVEQLYSSICSKGERT